MKTNTLYTVAATMFTVNGKKEPFYFLQVMSKYRRGGFWDTDRQVAAAVMETAQLVLSQFTDF